MKGDQKTGEGFWRAAINTAEHRAAGQRTQPTSTLPYTFCVCCTTLPSPQTDPLPTHSQLWVSESLRTDPKQNLPCSLLLGWTTQLLFQHAQRQTVLKTASSYWDPFTVLPLAKKFVVSRRQNFTNSMCNTLYMHMYLYKHTYVCYTYHKHISKNISKARFQALI